MRIFMRRNGCAPTLIRICVNNVPRLLLLGIIITFFVFSARTIYDLSKRSIKLDNIYAAPSDLPYATDDEPFLHLVDKTYNDEDLYEWEPAVYNGTKPGDLGHLGAPFWVPPELQEIAKKRFLDHQINVVANEMMSYNRTLPDGRHPNCRSVEYPKKLPQTSVIIIFHNEAFSVLMRTVWNIYSKSPRTLVKEIILVDDASDHEELGQKLDDYVKTIPVKVVVVRMMKRAGLIQAKILAAKYVTAPVMTFLDAHMEMIEGWLEPLLTIVSQDRTTIANPVMDHLRYDSMEYISSGFINIIGMFDWSFIFNWIDIPEREQIRTNNDPTAPLRMPAMVGGLFSIDREFFYKLGTYDGGMKIWAGDDVEMSIRAWSCGGSILLAPCSRMGHLTRAKRIHAGPLGWFRLLISNTARMADVWTDEWSEFLYTLYPIALGWRSDVTERKKLRKQLRCKSFSWYLKNAYPESTLNLERYHMGIVESTLVEGYCLDPNGGRKDNSPLALERCAYGTANHVYILTKKHEIRARQVCLDAESPEKPLRFKKCHNEQGSQKFAYINETRSFEFNDTGACLHVHDNMDVVLKPCDGSDAQEWDLATIKILSN